MPLHRTRNDLPEATRTKSVGSLDALLASAIDLSLQAKQAHWNVKGPQFRELHLLFDEVNAGALEWQDLIAERIAQLGGSPHGNLQTTAKNTKLPSFAPERSDGPAFVDAMAKAISSFTTLTRPAIDEMAQLGDTVSADMLTEVTRAADTKLWFVEAHLQAER
jgi:starvation-inducible DNA-binding protein